MRVFFSAIKSHCDGERRGGAEQRAKGDCRISEDAPGRRQYILIFTQLICVPCGTIPMAKHHENGDVGIMGLICQEQSLKFCQIYSPKIHFKLISNLFCISECTYEPVVPESSASTIHCCVCSPIDTLYLSDLKR